MGRPRKTIDWNPKESTKNALDAATATYKAYLENIKMGVDKEATGSDRLNELKALDFAVDRLPALIKRITELQAMYDKEDFGQEKDIISGRTEELM